jgi:hypothetical protein
MQKGHRDACRDAPFALNAQNRKSVTRQKIFLGQARLDPVVDHSQCRCGDRDKLPVEQKLRRATSIKLVNRAKLFAASAVEHLAHGRSGCGGLRGTGLGSGIGESDTIGERNVGRNQSDKGGEQGKLGQGMTP